MQLHCTAASTALFAALMLSAAPGPAAAQEPRVERLDVIAAGFYVGEPTGQKVPAPGTASGIVNGISKAGFLTSTPAVTAKVGTAFGVEFRVVGQPNNAKVKLRTVWQIPAPGITNPESGNVYRQNTVDFTATTGTIAVRGYRFDKAWEVVPGQWTLQIWQGDRKLLERSFTIQ
jgi:hypothetical protein